MRIPVRDFYTISGALLICVGLASLMSIEDSYICVSGGLIIGIPLLIVGLRMQTKYSQSIYGDNRIVKWVIWGILGGLLLAYFLIGNAGK